MGKKSHHQVLLSHFLGPIGASFRYLENVGKYNVAYQYYQSLEVHQYGEYIMYSVRYCNPLIHSEGVMGAVNIIDITLLLLVRIYTHLFHNIVYVMFSFVAVLRGMI